MQLAMLGPLRERGLGQQDVNAVIDVIVVTPRVFLERVDVLGQPDSRFQLVFENLEINLARARQLRVIHLVRKFLERLARVGQPTVVGRTRDVVEQMIKPVVTQLRGLDWPLTKSLLQVVLEKAVQLRLRILGGSR